MSPTRAGALAFLLGLGVGAGTSCGPPGGDCSPALCPSGCCDATGACRSGSVGVACGHDGLTCAICATGEVCESGSCVTHPWDAGTGGGGSAGGGGSGGFGGGYAGGSGGWAGGGGWTGGGIGGGGGGGGGAPWYDGGACLTLVVSPPFTTLSAESFVGDGGGPFSHFVAHTQYGPGVVDAERWYSSPPVVPLVAPINPGAWIDCFDCVLYRDLCDGGACQRLFLAQAGLVTYLDAGVGHFAGRADNLQLIEWSLLIDGGQVLDDRPVPAGACFNIPSVSWDGCYLTDGGC